MTVTTAIRRAVAIALVAFFGLGTSAIPAVFAGFDGCQSSEISIGCCCGMDGEDCGCGGSCCGEDADTPPKNQNDDDTETPAIVCLCGLGDSTPAVPTTAQVSVDALMRASANCHVEILDLANRPTRLRHSDDGRAALVSATTVLRL